MIPRAVLLFSAVLIPILSAASTARAEIPPNTFVKIAGSEEGGHFFSQIVYAPTIEAFVSWGTQTHSHPIRTFETRHFLVAGNRWVDAWPRGKETAWAAAPRQWPDWNICATAGTFTERDGVIMPRPTSSFYQATWDAYNKEVLFYVASMTFRYNPVARAWRLVHDRKETAQPPALLLWSSLCYDPVNRRAILFGGGGVDRRDGRPHTWALDVTTDRWSRLQLDVEPPARCNSRMVFDRRHEVIVLFGGDGQDRGLADTWVFDVRKNRWAERHPARSPYPRHCHAMAALEKSGKVLLVGGRAVADYRKAPALSNQVWAYNAGDDTWTPVRATLPEIRGHQWYCMENLPGTDEVLLVVSSKYDHSQTTYRFRYDPSAPLAGIDGVAPGTVAFKTQRTRQWYEEVEHPDVEAHAKVLSELKPNRWVEVKPPRSTAGRTWGTAIFDTDRSVAMKWGGGHSGYQGTDMAFYDVAGNRFSVDRTPAFTPEPFDRWARRPCGRTFFNQPWCRHARHTCAYDRIRKVGVFTDAGGSAWYDRGAGKVVKHTWLYDPVARQWLEPIEQPFPGGGTYSPIAVSTQQGVAVYQLGKVYRFAGEPEDRATWTWEEIPVASDARPRQHEHMTIVFDQRRDRLIFLSADKKDRPLLWFFSFRDRVWTSNPHPAPGGVTTREAVYVPGQDAILAYGPARKDDPVWTRVYLCDENRWTALPVETPQYLVHEVALVYDPAHDVSVLLWPPRFERDIRPHLFRLVREGF